MYRKNDSFGDFSLPTQRCFSSTRSARGAKTLFSAYAEVFLSAELMALFCSAFLCLRRGVSHRLQLRDHRSDLFSAYAEVFLHYAAL